MIIQPHHLSANGTTLLTWMLIASVLLAGCGRGDTGPTVEELVKQQKIREATEAAKPMSDDERIKDVREYLDNRSPQAAEAALRPLLISDSSHPEVMQLSAEVKAALGDPRGAATMLMDHLEGVSEPSSGLLFLAAKWFREAGDDGQAAATLQRVIVGCTANPQSPECVRAHRQLAELFNESDQRLAAKPHLIWLACQGVIREKELYAMIAYSDPFVESTPPKPNSAEQVSLRELLRAKLLRHDGNLTRATKLTETLTANFPNSTSIAAFRGRLYAELHDLQKLLQWHSQLPPGMEAQPEYWLALGVLKNQQSQPKEAVRCFAEALLRDHTNRFAYRELSRALASLGQEDAAECVQQKLVVLDEATQLAYSFGSRPGSEAELHRLADLLHELRRDAEAIAWRALALKRFGGLPASMNELIEQRNRLDSEGRLPRDEPESMDKSDDWDAFVLGGLELNRWPLPTPNSPIATPSDSSHPTVGEQPSIEVPICLVNVASEIGLEFQYQSGADFASERVLLHQLTGGGIGVLDMDCDGWPDLYFTQSGGDAHDEAGSAPNQLYRNLGGRHFQDASASTQTGDKGYAQGVAVADLNQDGFPDLVVANIGPNRVFINQGDGTFQQRHADLWETHSQWTTTIACGDVSGDGLPEIVEINYINDPTAFEVYCEPNNTQCNPSQFKPAVDRMWQIRNDGEITSGDSIWLNAPEPAYGFAAILANFDGQSGCDVFIANDRVANDLWLSQMVESPVHESVSIDGVNPSAYGLSERSQLHGCATGVLGQQQGCMGIAAGDFDRNGKMDFHVTNFWNQPADLYLQGDQGFFIHASINRGLDETTKRTVAWGTQAVDFDRNGWLDLAVLNGHLIDRHVTSEPFRMRPQLFAGDASGFQLRAADELASPDESVQNYWQRSTLGRTMAVLDWNVDGKLDLVCNHLDVPAALLENRTSGGNAVQFELVGVTSERDAVGAEVTIVCSEERWTSWVTGGDGFLCSNEPLLDIGIGLHERIEEVLVQWPSGVKQRLTDIEPNRRYLIVENQDSAFVRSH